MKYFNHNATCTIPFPSVGWLWFKILEQPSSYIVVAALADEDPNKQNFRTVSKLACWDINASEFKLLLEILKQLAFLLTNDQVIASEAGWTQQEFDVMATHMFRHYPQLPPNWPEMDLFLHKNFGTWLYQDQTSNAL